MQIGQPRPVSAPVALKTDLASKKWKQLRGEGKCVAIYAVQYDQLKIFQVAKQFGILRQILGDRVSRRVTHETKPVHIMKEESELVKRLNMNRTHNRLR